MSVGSKLALLMFGLAVLLMAVLMLLSSPWPLLHLLGIEPFLEIVPKIEVSTLIASFAILLLLWERLRESQRSSLKAIHERVLFDLSKRLSSDFNLFRMQASTIRGARDDLERYGKFLGIISLHPLKSKRIDNFIKNLETFEKNIKQIVKLGKENMGRYAGVTIEKILKTLGFEPIDPQAMSIAEKKRYDRMAQELDTEHHALIVHTQQLLGLLKALRKLIHDDLESFFRTNNLPDLVRWGASRQRDY